MSKDGLTRQQRYRNKMIQEGFLVRTYYVHKDDLKKITAIIQSRMRKFAHERIDRK
jgi:hypothetical protein